MGFSGGKQSSSQSSKPLTPLEMQEYYDQAMKNLGPLMPGNSYQAPAQQTLTGGDYAALEKAYAAPVQRQQDLALKTNDQAMADRGIYTSLNAIRAGNDVRETYAPQFASVGGFTMGMKANEQAQGNQMALANAQAQQESAWRPADYLGQLWGGGKANKSSGKSSGFSFGVTAPD